MILWFNLLLLHRAYEEQLDNWVHSRNRKKLRSEQDQYERYVRQRRIPSSRVFYARGDGPSLCCCESSSKLTQQIYDSLQTGNISAQHRHRLFVFVASITSIQLMFVRRNNCADGSCDGSRGPVPKFRQSRDIQIWMSYDLQFRTCLGIPRRGKKGY